MSDEQMDGFKNFDDITADALVTPETSGITKIHLDHGIEITTVGLVYGVEHLLRADGYEARIFLDTYNKRIRILQFCGQDLASFIMRVRVIAELNGFDKIIYYASKEEWQTLLGFGYVLEAMIKYYDQGKDVFVMSKFRSQERLSSSTLMDEILLIESIMAQNRSDSTKEFTPEIQCKMAVPEDISQLADLYSAIFATYPSPLAHEEYLRTVFQKTSIFIVAKEEDKIVAAASAELNSLVKSAEITDCATLRTHRGRGIMTQLVKGLEKDLIDRNYTCAYTLARARSVGMNRTFYNLSYEFNGRLINNCDIYGGLEDMNIWTKSLRK